jgi:YfiH family protein
VSVQNGVMADGVGRSAGTGPEIGLFTTRHGFPDGERVGRSRPPYDEFNLGAGVGDDPASVQANRTALADRLGLGPDRLVWMKQVHGSVVAQVTGSHSEPLEGTDAMVTATPGIGLAVLVADCVPVLAADRRAGVVGVAHAGRVGAAAGVVPSLIEAMGAVGSRPADVQVLLGPAICGNCYEVPSEMRDDVEARLPGAACTTADGTPGLDLRAGILGQLRAAGVGLVEIDGRCTREDSELFSHRRSAPTGRFAGVVRL